jgi:hypothetical protein
VETAAGAVVEDKLSTGGSQITSGVRERTPVFISEALNTALLAAPVPCFEVADAPAFA